MEKRFQYNILAVDDEIFNLESIQRVFRKDYEVFTTTSAGEALDIFRSENIHLIIADQRMPEMKGTELLEKIKQISPHPIRIVLSAYTDIEYLIDAINHGEVYHYITKPWEPNDLRITVQKALEHYQAMIDRHTLTEKLEKKNILLDSKNLELQQALQQLKEAQSKLIEMERTSIIGKMASMIIHDLKQPLDIIRSAAETMARMELETEERIEFAEMIKFEVERFLEMIRELLDYSKGTFESTKDMIQLSDFWGITENRIRNYIQDFDVDFRFIPEDEDAYIYIDRHRLQRALINLVKNALEALKQDRNNENPQIILSTGITDKHVIFHVEDNGPGIPQELRDKIFTPFVSSKKIAGIGLGLAIVKDVVEEHQGEITFNSEPNRGTTFSIFLNKQNNNTG